MAPCCIAGLLNFGSRGEWEIAQAGNANGDAVRPSSVGIGENTPGKGRVGSSGELDGFLNSKSGSDSGAFYDDLADGVVCRSLWGVESRFSAKAIPRKVSVNKYFVGEIARWLKPEDTVLDLGCGPGGFLAATAPVCGKVVGVDVSARFVEACRKTIADEGISNAEALHYDGHRLPFDDGTMDAVVMVDVIHHLAEVDVVLDEVSRVLRSGGVFLVFEPNKLNPLLAALCALDRNEWGLLSLGSKRAYRKLLEGRFELLEAAFNGLLIGPESRLVLWLADLLADSALAGLLGWLSPKIFIAARKP